MAIHNPTNGYDAFPVRAPHIISLEHPHLQSNLHDGLYYRDDSKTQDEYLDVLTDGKPTIFDYQSWTDQGWKRQHGTPEAAGRFIAKLEEETHEFIEEVINYKLGNGSPIDLKSEAGDVIWCATALASIMTGDIGSGLKNKLYEYVAGTRHIDDSGQSRAPSWRNKAAELSTKYESLALSDIDQLLAAKFEPAMSPIMNIDEDDSFESDAYGHIMNIGVWTTTLSGVARKVFQPDEDQDNRILINGGLPTYGREAAEITAAIYLETAWVVRRLSGDSLVDITQYNARKISGRIQNNQVDKTDSRRD